MNNLTNITNALNIITTATARASRKSVRVTVRAVDCDASCADVSTLDALEGALVRLREALGAACLNASAFCRAEYERAITVVDGDLAAIALAARAA